MNGVWKDSPPSTDYRVHELMITTLADYFRNGEQVCNGMASFIPVAAFMLARNTHAPDLVWFASSVGLDPRPRCIPASTLEAALWKDSIMYLDQYRDFWDLVQDGRWITDFCVGAAQIDQYGNANNSVIGDDYDAPVVRLPGTAGLADMCSIDKNLYFWVTDHSPRSLVEKVDFISGAGWLGGADERADLGLGGGPVAVISNLAVMDFHPSSKRMRLKSVHPGIGIEQVKDATGFQLLLPDDANVPETRPPTVAQVKLIREKIDPNDTCGRGLR